MKDEDFVLPPAMKIRQTVQDSMTHTLPEKEFSSEDIDLVEINVELPNLGENFHNYRAEDINELADELSVILASKMNRKAAAF